MTAAEIIRQIEALPADEQAKMREWFQAHSFEESPSMLDALDAAARSADVRGTTPVKDVRRSLAQWISKSA